MTTGVGEPADRAELAHLRHELRTPLNHIIGYAEMLLEDLDRDPLEISPGLRQIHDDAHTVLGLVNEFLAPARVAAESRSPTRSCTWCRPRAT